MKYIICCFLLFANMSCKHTEPSKIEKRDANDPAFTSKYICPMHCKGSGSNVPGVCPVCGMDYELNADFKEN